MTLDGTDHGKPGYSDAEYRRIVNAARADAAAIRDRIRRGRKLVQLWRNDGNGLTAEDSRLAEQLAAISASGDVPEGPNGTTAAITRFRSQLAQHLYVTKVDVTPLMLLLVALTGLNAESVKELPADHRVLEDCAVELEFVKRRRGAGHWNQTVTWEIGPPGRELHHPGGLYLLLLDLMAPSRAISGSTTLWCIWRNGHRLKLTTADEHGSPFDGASHTHIARSQAWSARRGLLADGDDQPLVVTMQRLRTTVQIRRTKQMGGHLPSAAKTNTIHTLFRDYLRDDPVVRDWAGDVVADALAEAERAALDAHRRALTSTGGKLEVRADDSGLEGGVHPTAWGSCKDPDRHPHSGKPCRANVSGLLSLPELPDHNFPSAAAARLDESIHTPPPDARRGRLVVPLRARLGRDPRGCSSALHPSAAGEGSRDRTLRRGAGPRRSTLGKPMTASTAAATGSADLGTVRLWNADTREQIGAPLKGHTTIVWSVAFSPDGHRLATASEDHTVRLWNADTREPIGDPLIGHTDAVESVAFSPDGRRLATASDDKTVRLWPAVATPDMLCDKLTANMGHQEWRKWVSPDIGYQQACPNLPVPD